MTPDVVVDVGNTRIKWGRCQNRAVVATASLEPDDPAAWQLQRDIWRLDHGALFVVTGVHPERRGRLAEWLSQHGAAVRVVKEAAELPLLVRVEKPDHVGVDRLFDAVAANHYRGPGRGAVVVDAGSAVTVDWIDVDGAFSGGAIFPGIRLMALALHQYTALLPLIESPRELPPLPGASTRAAMAAGIVWATGGGVKALIEQYSRLTAVPPHVFLTGGDGLLLHRILDAAVEHRPDLTLEGIRLTAESLP
jgi:type III pantothenate kinase